VKVPSIGEGKTHRDLAGLEFLEMQRYDFDQIHLFLSAVLRLIDPHRALLAAARPYVMTGGSPLDTMQLVAGGKRANEVQDADLIHLVFEHGREAEGPVNVMVAMERDRVIGIRTECRFWLNELGQPFLIAKCGGKFATMSFDPEGMDSQPGAPAGDLEPGYARAMDLLRRSAATGIFANDAAVCAEWAA
jgi:hypothetical protein